MERNPHSHRRGYILIVILGFAAVVTSLGLAFLDSHSTVVPEAVNRYGAIRAQYMAESGVAIANHFLMYPPTTVSGCAYWPGANNIAVDASSDYTNVTVVQDASNSDVFTVTALGVALNPDGTVRGKRTVTAKVARPAGRMAKIPYALLGNAGAMAGSTFGIQWNDPPIKVYGNLHAQGGSMWSAGFCNGAVSATGSVCWSGCGGTGPPTSVVAGAASFSIPPMSPMNYQTYTLNGTTYAAATAATGDWGVGEGAAITAILDSSMATNPGRVIYRSGNLRLRTNFNVNCTLAVTGALTIDGTGIQVTAVQDFPALVLAGNLTFGSANRNASLVGPVYIGGYLMDGNNSGAGLNVTGACILRRGFLLTKTDGTYRFTWDCDRAMFWDFANITVGEVPITILSWKEN